MSVAVMQNSTFYLDQWSWPASEERCGGDDVDRLYPAALESNEERPGQSDIWRAIQFQKAAVVDQAPAAPYVHPLARRSSSLLSQKSLEVCTESLGSETGSDDFFTLDDLGHYYPPELDDEENDDYFPVAEREEAGPNSSPGKELTSMNYHCSTGRRSPMKSFPPPLSSISRRNGPCIHMRSHRRDGRLVVEAVPVPSQNYLHAQRVNGRLLLSFIETSDEDELGYQSDDTSVKTTGITLPRGQEDAVLEEDDSTEVKEEEELGEHNCYGGGEELDEKNFFEDEEEEEVEVVDRGAVVEVKVSTQPQQQSGATKVYRSSLVINKFVGGMPHSGQTGSVQPRAEGDKKRDYVTLPSTLSSRRASTTSTSAAAAASTLGTVSTEGYSDGWLWSFLGDQHTLLDNKLLFTSRRRNREELLHNMRRCSQLRRPFFICEACYVATSS